MSKVFCRLPKSGLGNQLFPLMKAQVFGHLNKLPIITTGYHYFKIGPYLRGEKIKRRYNNYFIFQKNLIAAWLESLQILKYKEQSLVKEPPLEKIEGGMADVLYEFNAIPHWEDYFGPLREQRELVLKLLPAILRDSIIQKVNTFKAPCIGVHIRMGDFRKLQAGEEFNKVGSVRTPETYFIEMINNIRRIHGSALPVSVFTDGYRHELENLWGLENISLVEGNLDIVDLLLLSHSRIIVTSAGSTFSYWSGFLANAPVIMHPGHIHAPLRPPAINQYFYEGPLIPGQVDPLLEKNIRAIGSEYA